MLIRVLGPVVANLSDGSRFDPPSEGQRKLLALLALRAGRAVAADTICDLFELTPGAVRTTVSRLRKALGDALVTENQGYALHAETDVQKFQSLVATAKTAGGQRASALRSEALALFAEPALHEFSDEPWAVAEVTRLTELRSAVVEDLIEGYIDVGLFDDAIDGLHRHLLEHPYRDRPHELLMLAFARSGRQVEALRVFQEYRTRLIDEVGVDPGVAITELDRQILVGELSAAPVEAEQPQGVATQVLAPLSTDQGRSNLQFPANEFVGRQAEIAEVGQALAESRLVTLLGPGGVGKTRLSLRVAAEQIDAFSDGAWVAELVHCETGSDVLRSIADVFGLSDVTSAEECATQLAGHELLLVLDNCEHVIDQLGPIVDTLLARTARLKILATSRVRLMVVGERSVQVLPMRTDGEAQDLFVSRAAATGAVFDEIDLRAVGDICERLDGIPLALELAAASSRVLAPVELLERLEDRFALLKDGPRGAVAGRHESLRTAVDSSYDSLDEPTQIFFRRIAVLAGDFPLAAAEALADDLPHSAIELLVDLVDRSLLTAQSIGGRSRYRLLETLRQYGEDRLRELDELEHAIELHVDWCLSFAEQLGRKGFGASEPASLNELVASSGNFRLAIARLLDARDFDRAGDLVLKLEDFGYASRTLVGLVGPVIEAGVADTHPASQRLHAMELIRRATSGSTDTRRELAAKMASALQPEDPGAVQLAVLLISTALSLGPGRALAEQVIERAEAEPNTAEKARLLAAAGFAAYYGDDLPDDLALVEAVVVAARQAGMKRLTVAAASMACMAGLRLEQPSLGADIARPFLDDLNELGHASIMSNGLVSMYTEAAIQANMAPSDQLAAVRLVGPNLRGDFNKLGQAMARLVQHHGQTEMAVRALGACAAIDRSTFSTGQRAQILEIARGELSDREVEALLATGAVSETTDLYREMWSVLEPFMAA